MKRVRKSATVTWYGHSAFLCECAGKRVLFDPWMDNPRAPARAKDVDNVDLILISHGHSDHLGNAAEIAQRTEAKVVAIFEVALYLQGQGVENVTGMNKGGSLELDGVRVTMVDAKHSSDIDIDGKVVATGGEAAGFVVQFPDKFRLYHAGDTALFGDMRFIGKLHQPDAALLPIGDLYTMGPREAAIACDLIKPKYIIGMHYGTFPALAGTPQQLRRHLHTKMKKKLVELEPGIPVLLA